MQCQSRVNPCFSKAIFDSHWVEGNCACPHNPRMKSNKAREYIMIDVTGDIPSFCVFAVESVVFGDSGVISFVEREHEDCRAVG